MSTTTTTTIWQHLTQYFRSILLLCIVFFAVHGVKAQEVVVSSYFNSASSNLDEWTELLVISDNVNLNGWTIRDNNSLQTSWQQAVTFSNSAFWNNMRAGTIIIIWHRPVSSANVPHPIDTDKSDGYIELCANNTTYFSGGDFGSSPSWNGSSLNISNSGDLIELRKPDNTHVHVLGHMVNPGSSYTALPTPKLNHTETVGVSPNSEAVYVSPGSNLAEYGSLLPQSGTVYTDKSITDISFGLPNPAPSSINVDYWRLLRQPLWSTPVLNISVNSTYNQEVLNWNNCTDPNPADNTTGYLLLRSSTNVFTHPTDGTIYAAGNTIGSATVISVINGSQNTTYTDNYSLGCGEQLYYRVYTYRYSVDNQNGNSFHIARGRAYNESSFAQNSAAGAAAPVVPTSASVSNNTLCSNDNGNITLYANGGSGSNLEWFDDYCGGNLIGATNNLSVPSPENSTTYFVRWVSPGCPASSCISVPVLVTQAPTQALAGADQSKCGVLNTVLEGNTPVSGTGIWSVLSGSAGYTIGNPSQGTSTFQVVSQGIYKLKWTIATAGPCVESSDTVSVEFGNAVNVAVGSNSPVCNGDTLYLTSSINNATYAWSGPGFSSNVQNPVIYGVSAGSGGLYSITVSGISGGCPTTSGSTQVVVNNLPITPPISSQNINGNQQDACIESQVPYSIEPPNPGSVYEWTLNGGGYIIYTLDPSLINITWNTPGNYQLSVVETNQYGCKGNPVVLNIIVNNLSVASVSIQSNANPVCQGQTVTFTATSVNQGTSPVYKWFVNGIQMAGNTNTLTYQPSNNDQVYAQLLSSSPCALPNPAQSQTLIVSVTENVLPSVIINADKNPACTGDMVLFTALPVSPGTTPIYQWFKNAVPVGANSNTYSDNTLENNDIIFCELTSSDPCALPQMVQSNSINMVVGSPVNVSVNIVADKNPGCDGETITFTANGIGGGSMPVYNWFLNGNPDGGNSTFYSKNTFVNGDIVYCTLLSSEACPVPASAQSNSIGLVVNPSPIVTSHSVSNPTQCGWADGSITLYGLATGNLYEISYNFNGTPQVSVIQCNSSGNVVVTGLAAGLYSDIKATLSGCSSAPFNEALTDPGTTSAPIITASLSSICPGEKTQLTATGCSGTVTWSNGSTGALVEVSPGVTTTYTSTCTFNGCTSLPSNPVVVTVKTLPLSTGYLITSPTTSCTDDGEILFAGLLPSTLYQIEYVHNGNPHSAMLTSDLDGNLKLTQCEKGDYTAITFNNEGCKSLPQNITIQDPLLPVPPVIVAAEATVCPGQLVHLTAVGCSGNIVWSDGSTGTQLTISEQKIAGLTANCVVNGCNSASSVALVLQVHERDISHIVVEQNACLGETLKLVAEGDADSLRWYLPNGDSQTSSNLVRENVTVSDSGYYALLSYNLSGCADKDSIHIEVLLPANIQILSDGGFCAGVTQNLSIQEDMLSYLWSTGETDPMITVSDEGMYSLIVTDLNNCNTSTTASLKQCSSEIYFPTAFTPDFNGFNDTFKPVLGSNTLISYSISIYNKWGQLVYQSSDPVMGWDGRFKNEDCPTGIYNYVVRFQVFTDVNQTKPEKLVRGSLTLVR